MADGIKRKMGVLVLISVLCPSSMTQNLILYNTGYLYKSAMFYTAVTLLLAAEFP